MARAWGSAADQDDVERPLGPEPGHEPVQLLEHRSIAAVVRPVALADFTAEALRARLADPDWLEAMVQLHNAVIGAVHQERAILPSKFGAVYAHPEDVVAALEQAHDALLARLAWLDGCDEWAVHLYVDQQALRAGLSTDPDTVRLQQDLAAASPGRAYLLRRKLDDDLAERAARISAERAQLTYERLARLATAAQAERPDRPSGEAPGETEVLRAAFLVHRARRDQFLAEVRACAEDADGWRCTSSGPWPPYSFATFDERTGDEQPDV
jgi:hypothetical protein